MDPQASVDRGIFNLPSKAYDFFANMNVAKISNFLKSNKEVLFFATSSLLVFAASTHPRLNELVVEILSTAILTATSIQGIALLTGSKGFLGKGVHQKINVLLGIANIACWFINPECGVAAVVFNAGISLSSYAFIRIL